MNATLASWLTLAGLGAFHGLNPGMGWLFAVALGMQEGRRSAVWRALIPLTLGHALAIAGAIGLAMLAGTAISPQHCDGPSPSCYSRSACASSSATCTLAGPRCASACAASRSGHS